MIKFITWFKGSLEDEKGVASFRRIDNWLLICLVMFIVIYPVILKTLSMLHIYVLIILLVAGFLNTSVITVDNILRFFNRDKAEPAPAPEPEPAKQVDVSGTLNLTDTKPQPI